MLIPIAFISLVLGIILILINWIPFVGWIFLLVAIVSSIFKIIFKNPGKWSPYTKFIIFLIFAVIISIIFYFSITNILYSAKATGLDLASLI